MTIINQFEKRCSVCGKTSMQPVLSSTNSWGYPDLDLRPAPMKRDTMNTWLMECPHCGYVAIRLENELDVSPNLLKSDEYLTCGGHDFKSDLSKRFYRHYLISKAKKDYRSMFFSLLHCAWTCDDADDRLAVEIRKKAADSIDLFEADGDEKDNLKIMKADLLRRSLQFDRVADEFNDFRSDDDLLNSIIRFQIERALMKDSACYTVEHVKGEDFY